MNPLVNGQAYDFTQIVVKLFGEQVASVSAITYAEEQSKENNYGAGTRPVSRGKGTITASANITLSMNDIEQLRDKAEDGSLLKLPAFDVQVSFMNSQQVVTHILKNCEFMDDGVEASLDDKDIKKSFALVLSHVKYR